MGWDAGYGFKNSKKIKYRSLREKTTPFLHTRWPWWPFDALFVLCHSPVSAVTLANANLGQIRANFAQTSREFGPIFAYVPGSADGDEDLPLLEEDLVPPLLRGLPQRRSRLDVDAVLGGEGHEGRDVAARGVAVRRGQHVWGRRNIRVGEMVPRLSTRHDAGTRHVKQVFKRIGDTVVDAINKFFNKGTCQARGFGGL